MGGLSVAEAVLKVYVHPSNAGDVQHAVRRQLSSLLFTYDERFDGVLLAHEVIFRSEKAEILSGLVPYFGVLVNAKLLLFSPRPNMLLEGKVVKLGLDSIHATVHGFSSVAIMSKDIRDEFIFKSKDDGSFVSLSHKRHVIKVGSMIRFLAKSVDEEFLHITGSLIPPNTGCIRWLSKHNAEDTSQIDSGVKRQRDRDRAVEQGDQDCVLNSNRHHKSRKRTAEE